MTLTGRNERTLSGYVDSLLDYPRWLIERDIDFTHCEFQGIHSDSAQCCASCEFGAACHWLKHARIAEASSNPLPELLHALSTAVNYVDSTYCKQHKRGCECDNCLWMRQVRGFLRSHRHST